MRRVAGIRMEGEYTLAVHLKPTVLARLRPGDGT